MASPFTSAELLSSSSVVVLPRNYGDLLTCSPKYPNSRTGGTRSLRTQIDHDVFEGLPVRHWRKRAINVNTAPEKVDTNDIKSRNLAWPELEMPRDAHLLSEMSQHLLRAARMPQAKKTLTAPLMEDDKEAGEDEDADGEIDTGFVAKRWAVMPKEMEGPEPEFLAKRRKGLPSVHGGALATVGSMQQMRKTKIRKIDTSGNSSVLEVLVPDGQTVDGEIFEEETSPTQAPAPGTIVDGVGVVNAEGLVIAGDQTLPSNNRRRPPPPKRKAKGPGRGRRKKVAFATADGKPTSIEVNGVPISATRNEEGYLIDGAQGAPGQDTGMGDHSMLQEGDLEGEEGSEEGSEGEEGEDGEREEGELSPSASPSRSSPKATSPVNVAAQYEPRISLPDDPVPQSNAPSPTQTTSLISDPVLEPVTKPVNESTIGSKVEAMNEAPDEMLGELEDDMLEVPLRTMADEPVDGASPKTANTPAEDIMTQPHLSGDNSDHIIGESTETMHIPASEPAEETTAELETSTKASIGNAMSQAVEQLPANLTTASLADAVAQPVAEPVADPLVGHTIAAQTEPKPEPSIDVPSEPTANFILESSMDITSEPKAAFVPESSTNVAAELKTVTTPEPLIDVISEPKSDFRSESSVDTISEPKAAPILEPSAEQVSESKAESSTKLTAELAREFPTELIIEPTAETTGEPMVQLIESPTAESMAEPIREATPPSSTVSSAVTTIQAEEKSVPAPVIETEVEAIPEPVVQRVAEHYDEPVVETTERRFSFTRPTASPKGPTPSPPTPIEGKFGLRAPYYSPKAPTMSPPTPIARSIPSSPEMPLSEQKFRLPPQIDDMPEGELAPAPDMQDISDANRITVASTRQGGPQLNAQIPVDHNPLDGMAAPKVVYGYDAIGGEGDKEAPAQFSDGEEDLLGSLERSLDRRGTGS